MVGLYGYFQMNSRAPFRLDLSIAKLLIVLPLIFSIDTCSLNSRKIESLHIAWQYRLHYMNIKYVLESFLDLWMTQT